MLDDASDAMASDALVVPIVLFVQYAAVGLYVCVQIGILLYQRHRAFHYKAVFNWFALAWMLCRSVFWGLTAANVNWDGFLQNFIFWLPTCLNFLTFATLGLFLAKGIVSADAWRRGLRTRLVVAFGVCAVLDVAGSATFAALQVTAPTPAEANAFVNADAGFTAALFSVLGLVFVFVGYRLRRLAAWEFNRMFLFLPATVAVVVWLLAATFFSRVLYNILSSAGVVSINTGATDPASIAETILIYDLWEIAPLVLLLATIATGPRSSSASASAALDKSLLNYGVFGAINNEGSAKARRRIRAGPCAALGCCSCGDDDDGVDADPASDDEGDSPLGSPLLRPTSLSPLDGGAGGDSPLAEGSAVDLVSAAAVLASVGSSAAAAGPAPPTESSAVSSVAFMRSAAASQAAASSASFGGYAGGGSGGGGGGSGGGGGGLGVSGGLILSAPPPGPLQSQASARRLLGTQAHGSHARGAVIGSSSSSGGGGLGLSGLGSRNTLAPAGAGIAGGSRVFAPPTDLPGGGFGGGLGGGGIPLAGWAIGEEDERAEGEEEAGGEGGGLGGGGLRGGHAPQLMMLQPHHGRAPYGLQQLPGGLGPGLPSSGGGGLGAAGGLGSGGFSLPPMSGGGAGGTGASPGFSALGQIQQQRRLY